MPAPYAVVTLDPLVAVVGLVAIIQVAMVRQRQKMILGIRMVMVPMVVVVAVVMVQVAMVVALGMMVLAIVGVTVISRTNKGLGEHRARLRISRQIYKHPIARQ